MKFGNGYESKMNQYIITETYAVKKVIKCYFFIQKFDSIMLRLELKLRQTMSLETNKNRTQLLIHQSLSSDQKTILMEVVDSIKMCKSGEEKPMIIRHYLNVNHQITKCPSLALISTKGGFAVFPCTEKGHLIGCTASANIIF